MNDHQKTTQVVVATPSQATINQHQTVEKMAFFNEAGEAIDLAAVLADFETRIDALENPPG